MSGRDMADMLLHIVLFVLACMLLIKVVFGGDNDG